MKASKYVVSLNIHPGGNLAQSFSTRQSSEQFGAGRSLLGMAIANNNDTNRNPGVLEGKRIAHPIRRPLTNLGRK
jgi:hypothetical protein